MCGEQRQSVTRVTVQIIYSNVLYTDVETKVRLALIGADTCYYTWRIQNNFFDSRADYGQQYKQ